MDDFRLRENGDARGNVTGFFTALPFRMTVHEGDSGTEAGMTAKGWVDGAIMFDAVPSASHAHLGAHFFRVPQNFLLLFLA